VAIACQGGGSHAAFTAGVLSELLTSKWRDRFQLVALTGTSGGAMCASLTWRGLVRNNPDPDESRHRLLGFWRDLEIHTLFDAVTNLWGLLLARSGLPFEVSPYLYEPSAEPTLRALLHRHLDLENLTREERRGRPKLLLGATDILEGDRLIFPGDNLRYEDVVASAAVPPLFRAVEAEGRLCWDGLFATNPPVRELTDLEDDLRPEQIWVVQINPQRRQKEPRTMQEIIDRRNELAGNLSLGQELYFVDRINKLIEDQALEKKVVERQGAAQRPKYTKIELRVVEMEVEGLDYASKLDRTSAFIERLIEAGRERAEWFFDARSHWPRHRTAPPRSVWIKRD
jgi:NTE family protein